MNPDVRQAEAFLLSLNAAWKTINLYSPDHPAVGVALQKLRETLETLLGGQERVTLGLVHGTPVLDGTLLTAKPDLSQKLVTRLQNNEIEGITFLNGCTQQELRHLIELLGLNLERVEFDRELMKRQVSHILLVHLLQQEPREERQVEEVGDRVGAGTIYSRALRTVRKVFREARLGKVPSLSEVQRTVQDVLTGILKAKHTLMALTMIKGYDDYLFNHSVNVGILAMALGESLALDSPALRELGLGALLHDLGKVKVPETITRAPRKLTEEEWEIMKRHPMDGMRMLEQMGVQSEIALRVVKEHHVRFDRKGYPTLAPGEGVHPYTMLVTVTDIYDAMTTIRPHRRDFDPSQAIAWMQAAAGSHFDPAILEPFIAMLGIYPPGTVVRLTTGEVGVVTRPRTEDASRPWVRLVQDREGSVEGEEVDLMEWDPEAGAYSRSILLSVDPVLWGINVVGILQRRDGAAPDRRSPALGDC